MLLYQRNVGTVTVYAIGTFFPTGCAIGFLSALHNIIIPSTGIVFLIKVLKLVIAITFPFFMVIGD